MTPAVAFTEEQPKRWADDVEDNGGTPINQSYSIISDTYIYQRIHLLEEAPIHVDINEQPPPAKVHFEQDGTKVLTEYRINEDGKHVKVTLRVKVRTVRVHANKAVAERKNWKKFGEARGTAPGPDPSTTTYGEKVMLQLSTSGKHLEVTETDDGLSKIKAKLSNTRILCRICKGDHFTSKCPFKDSEGVFQDMENKESNDTMPNTPTTPAGGADDGMKSGKYVPPSMRAGASRGGESMNSRNRDDASTIRITNLSEDATESDVKDLVSRFGGTSRVYVARDQRTGMCKGFAFVTYYDKDNAEKAMASLNGYGYDNLILRVEWAKTNRD
ncbi:hypothetical protein SmJEL517_g04549 [Synchytrium microbalum]|uniref:Eukaryotic translation initiation factor 3 subunit G n=1 Tax=Synchytrium microbalum TaxID=1806994 RepID=A0A507C2N7_9FUNG|nr:uncharacterized protein SmJEL517_g04549 [Synchytrium microbalum]TPX32344.1 hypothetical protein SmJEL517_g04549 [Synchytrium microbalum]